MFLLVCVMLVLFPKEASMGAKEGLKMAFDVVIPSILPFAIAASAVVYSSLARVVGALLSPVFNKIFGLNPYGAVALLSAALGGYPTGSKVVCDMYKEGLITKEEGEKMLSYVNVGGVVFAVNICGMTAFSSYKQGVAIYIIHILSTLLGAIIINKREKSTLNIKEEISIYKIQKKSFMAVLGKSIASGGEVMINIVASFVVFYALIKAFQIEKIPFIASFVEMTKGVLYAGEIGSLPFAAMYFTFGGLSVFAQTESICEKYGFSLKYFYFGKGISSIIAYAASVLYVNTATWGIEGIVLSILATLGIISAVYLLRKMKRSCTV